MLPPVNHVLGRADLVPTSTAWQAQRASSLAFILNPEPGITPLASPPINRAPPFDAFRAAIRRYEILQLARAVEFAPPVMS